MAVKRLSRAEAQDREQLKKLQLGSKFPADWLKWLSKPVLKKLDRKIARHGWKLQRGENDWVTVVEKGTDE